MESSDPVIRGADVPVDRADWGTLQWLVGPNAPHAGLTVGRVTFKPGCANPTHNHPNCEEVLYVVRGTLEHSLPGGGTAVLNPGDCIVLPRGEGHRARNIGPDEAEVIVCFNTADRRTVGE